MPGSEHTGYYIIAFDFVYVGNGDGKLCSSMSLWIFVYWIAIKGCSIFLQKISYHLLPVRNLLMMSAVFSLVGGFILFIASVTLLDSLRKEDERAFRFWLWTMVRKYGIQIYLEHINTLRGSFSLHRIIIIYDIAKSGNICTVENPCMGICRNR